MSDLDLDAIEADFRYLSEYESVTRDNGLALVAEVRRMHSWDGLMALLDEHWPADIFPTLPDDDRRDPGPRIVSLLRWVDEMRAKEARVLAMADMIERGEWGEPWKGINVHGAIRSEMNREDTNG